MKPKQVKNYVGLVLGVSKSGKEYYSGADKYDIDSARINSLGGRPLGYAGAWKLTRLFNEGGGPKLGDLKDLVKHLAVHRPDKDKIIERLLLMGAVRISPIGGGEAYPSINSLKPTQYKSFYNFLNNLRNERT